MRHQITLLTFLFLTGCGDSSQYNNFSIFALSFNGSSQYLQSGTKPVNAYPFSISAWVKTTSSTAQTVAAICKSSVTNSYQELSISSTGTVLATSRNTTTFSSTSTARINNGNWHHVAAVYASATSRIIYVDGTAATADANNVAFDTNVNTWSIGRQCGSTPAQYFNGSIDEVSVFSVALSTSNVATIYNSGKPADLSTMAGLVSWYRNGEVTGDDPTSTIKDNKGSNHLTAVSMASSNVVADSP